MRTIDRVRKEMDELLDAAQAGRAGKITDRMDFLRHVVLYLERAPEADVIRKDYHKAKDRLKKIDAGFIPWCNARNLKMDRPGVKPRYHKEMRRQETQAHLNTLSYILDGDI